MLEHRARGIGAVQLGHRKVHQHHVGLGFLCDADRLAAVADGRDHLHVLLRLDQMLEAFGDYAVIVGNKDADRHIGK